MRAIFVLPSAGGGGGAHSIVQETLGLSRFGVEVGIATPRKQAPHFRVRYPELQAKRIDNPTYETADDLAAVIGRYQLAIATTALSVEMVREAGERASREQSPKLGYYVQDYEPLFYPPGSPEWSNARASFDHMKNALVFAKTDWLCDIVEANHNINMQRVQASIDHDVYYPVHRRPDEPLRVTAMVRPKTPRRAPRRTIRILESLAFRYGSKIDVSYFGCEPTDLAGIGVRPSPSLIGLGELERNQVANTLRHSDLFLDLSDYQAFGRTGLEGMACGCVPVLPVFGGAREYAEHGVNAYLVDTRSDDQILGAVDQFVSARPDRRLEMRDSAIRTALRYSVASAAYSEYRIFRDYLEGRSAKS